MDLLQLLRTLGALGTVLGLLAGALWAVRRYDIKLPGRIGAGPKRRLEIVERLAIDSRRSVALIRRDGREHLILLAPEGPLMIEPAIERAPTAAPEPQTAAEPASPQARASTKPSEAATPAGDLRSSLASLAALLDRARAAPQPPEVSRELRGALASLTALASRRREAPEAVPAPAADTPSAAPTEFRDLLTDSWNWRRDAQTQRLRSLDAAEPAHA